MNWTPELVERAVALANTGMSRLAIAHELGTTRNAVCGLLHRRINGYKREHSARKNRPPPRKNMQEPRVMTSPITTPLHVYKMLWWAVIERHARDALGDFAGTVEADDKDFMRARARRWLCSSDFEHACALAGVDAEYLFEHIARKVNAGEKTLGWRAKR